MIRNKKELYFYLKADAIMNGYTEEFNLVNCIHDFLFFLHLFQNSSSSHPLAIREMIATGIPAMKYIRPNDTVSGHINPNATQSNLSLSGKIL